MKQSMSSEVCGEVKRCFALMADGASFPTKINIFSIFTIRHHFPSLKCPYHFALILNNSNHINHHSHHL